MSRISDSVQTMPRRFLCLAHDSSFFYGTLRPPGIKPQYTSFPSDTPTIGSEWSERWRRLVIQGIRQKYWTFFPPPSLLPSTEKMITKRHMLFFGIAATTTRKKMATVSKRCCHPQNVCWNFQTHCHVAATIVTSAQLRHNMFTDPKTDCTAMAIFGYTFGTNIYKKTALTTLGNMSWM